jgi:hypothetical protein
MILYIHDSTINLLLNETVNENRRRKVQSD